MKYEKHFIIIFFLIMASVPIYADGNHLKGIKVDGTIGNAGAFDLPGPNYDIRAEYGKQAGLNLFHSFEQFNLHSDESAIFSGPDSVRNIIGRVTGGSSSWIDGVIRSDIPGADLYLLNPGGVMFGPNASLDLGGSFHVSTGDYVRLGENERFCANASESAVLSTAIPAAFGFLEDNAASITFMGGEIALPESERSNAGLRVSDGESISVIGGTIEMKGIFYQKQKTDENGNIVPDMETIRPGNISAPGGQIRIAAVASEGEVETDSQPSDFKFQALKGGKIILSDKAFADVSGTGPGSVLIRGGQFVVNDSRIHAKTLEGKDGGLVDIQADSVSLTSGTKIIAGTDETGEGSDIIIRANASVVVSGENTDAEASRITVAGYGNAEAGNLLIEAKDISFSDGAYMDSNTYGTGKGGDITLKAGETVIFSGESSDGAISGIQANTFAKEDMAENGGDILIEAKHIAFQNGAGISGNTFGKGNAGHITLRGREQIDLTGMNKTTGHGSVISSTAAEGSNGGKGGHILLETKDLLMTDGGGITAMTSGPGTAGDVTVRATGKATLSGADHTGQASGIFSTSIESPSEAGDAGHIELEADELMLYDGAVISASSISGKGVKSGKGGDITIRVSRGVTLSGVNPYGENEDGFGAGIYARARGVDENTGDAGKIFLEADSLLIENGAAIENGTNCDANGGTVEIRVRDAVHISGDASGIQLNAPSSTQLDYLEEFSPTDYNNSVSGIYAKSRSKEGDAGTGGHIHLSAHTLMLSDKGRICATSSGGGNAGDVELDVTHVQMETDAAISSESGGINAYHFSNISKRDEQILTRGDVIHIADMGDGKAGAYIHTKSGMLRIPPVYTVANIAEMNKLSAQYDIAEGDVVEVTNTGDGTSGHFIYAYDSDYGASGWAGVGNHVTMTVANMPALNQIGQGWYSVPDGESPPYANGDVIRVTDAGDGKPAEFVYTAFERPSEPEWILAKPVRRTLFPASDITVLNALPGLFSLKYGDMAVVPGTDNEGESRFVFEEGKWLRFKDARTVANIEEQNRLVAVQTGNLAKIADAGNGHPGSFVYSGEEWVAVNNIYRVSDIAERDRLNVQTGDVADVVNADSDTPIQFLYSRGKWIKFEKYGDAGSITIHADTMIMEKRSVVNTSSSGNGKAGDIDMNVARVQLDADASVSSFSNSADFGGAAGEITINAGDSLRVLGNSSLTTEARGAGGGKIFITAGNEIYLLNGDITSSVRHGQGKGGDVSARSEFVILNHGNITANAEDGDGGAIFIHTDNYIKSAGSNVTATSKRGNDGTVKIEAPDLDISSSLTILPGTFLDAARWMKTPCAARSEQDVSHFIIKGGDAVPNAFDDWQPSPPAWSGRKESGH